MKKENKKIAIIGAEYRKEIVDDLVSGCLSELKKKGIKKNDVEVFRVPGALEIPLLAKKLAKKGGYGAIIVFGVILKGDTYHFEQVSDECARGCMNVSYEFEIPVIFQVLSVYTLSDAEARSKGTKDNRGIEAAHTALKMVKLYKSLGHPMSK